ncbi:hypothetical protein [Microcoleus sp. B4-D4]
MDVCWSFTRQLPKHDDAMAQVAFDELARADSLKKSEIRQFAYQLRVK